MSQVVMENLTLEIFCVNLRTACILMFRNCDFYDSSKCTLQVVNKDSVIFVTRLVDIKLR